MVLTYLGYRNKAKGLQTLLAVMTALFFTLACLSFVKVLIYYLFPKSIVKFFWPEFSSAFSVVLSAFISIEITRINNSNYYEKNKQEGSHAHYLYSIYYPSGTVVHILRSNEKLIDLIEEKSR
ncbi:hypothetical protein ACI3E1_07710 [Ligilactobacillus sp. LYQ139]|uniref:hypothetical protein n=1 Tax=Ligilactobacillus sp. LYQ139 TaxID=3378800 RepID=UPI003853EEE1